MADSSLIEQITSNPFFLRLKNVVENIEGFHNHEDVFTHSVKTSNVAKEKLNGDFISNAIAKESFKKWVDEDVFGIKRGDALVIIGLLHDCGKLLEYREGDSIESLITEMPQTENQTMCPGHEFYGGSLVVKKILSGLNLNEKTEDYVVSVVGLHDTFNNSAYFTSKSNWKMEDLISHIKSQGEGFYKEELFNSYCDCYYSKPFSETKAKIEEIFNQPSLYIRREYFVPEA